MGCVVENGPSNVRDSLRKTMRGLHTRSCAALIGVTTLMSLSLIGDANAQAQQPAQQRPNIVVIMGDDIGIWNIGAYHRGMMAGRTPNLDQLAAEGMIFTDYYAEASCTAGRANFITGRTADPHWTDHRRSGRLSDRNAGRGADHRDRAQEHGLRHRPVRQEPSRRSERVSADGARLRRILRLSLPSRCDGRPLPCELSGKLKATVGPRNMVHSWATNVDDATVQPRWGKIGKQRIEDDGELCPKRMETVDDEILGHTVKFLDKARADKKPFFLWLNPTRMHVVTHLSPTSTTRCAIPRMAGRSRKPAWRSSTTSSVRS